MENAFEEFIEDLALHEREKTSYQFNDPRNSLLITAGLHLNWLGDFFSNPKVRWQKKSIPLAKIKLTGTNPKWNKVLLEICGRSPEKFKKWLEKNPKQKNEFKKYASFGKEPILVRPDEKDKGFYKVLDGMHRTIGAILENKKVVSVWLPLNAEKNLPYCEPHVIYDLIRAYIRHAKDENGEKELYYALKLLIRTYSNVRGLLQGRLGEKWIPDKDAVRIIKKALKNS